MNQFFQKNTFAYCFVFLVWINMYAEKGCASLRIPLTGIWSFKLDPESRGEKDKWYSCLLDEKIMLPGTTDEAYKGNKNTERSVKHLSRIYTYLGAAWYQYEVEIPNSWENKHIELFMERTKKTKVWWNNTYMGSQNTLVGTQCYLLSSAVSPGRHRITVCVDNADLPPIGHSHQISEDTQTNWNGILGKIELRAYDDVWFKNILAYTDIHENKIQLKIKFSKDTPEIVKGKVTVSAQTWNTKKSIQIPRQEFNCIPDTSDYFIADVYVGEDIQLWDEFSPVLYKLQIDFEGQSPSKKHVDSRVIDVGMREFTVKGTQFAINGKTIFLRGKHDAGVFPLTGYAPMTVNEWQRVFKIAKSYGFNHYRFHTWCPPQAAFQAADIEGIYMQPELPVWGSYGKADKKGNDVEQKIDCIPIDQRVIFAIEEGKRIMDTFGNHASFVMFALGNELFGSREVMQAMIKNLRQYDNRKLYAQGANNFYTAPIYMKGDDYWITAMTGGNYSAGNYFPNTEGKDVRGSYPVYTVGHVNNILKGTTYDFRRALEGISVPVIGHETGQYGIYPNYQEIAKYTGVLRPEYLYIFRERLQSAGMLEQADDFFRASGALSVLCYREEIETALRTPGFAGFQLLDLQDFPGQGVALVGILDAFMDSKGLIEPEDWRHFCQASVPLIRMDNFVWTAGQPFTATAEIAHYGSQNIEQAGISWLLTDESDNILLKKNLRKLNIPQGSLTDLGQINFHLPHIDKPQKLYLTLQINDLKNSYPIWVFPKEKAITSNNIIITSSLDTNILNQLEKGKKVLFFPDSASIKRPVPGTFQADFWTYAMFKKYKGPGTMGMLCQPDHPALKGFPTSYHADWQWFRLLRYNPAMILDDLPSDIKPIIQIIDHFDRNHKIATLIEVKVGKGKLMICSFNLLNTTVYPEIVCLRNSIIKYMESEEFRPKVVISRVQLSRIVDYDEL